MKKPKKKLIIIIIAIIVVIAIIIFSIVSCARKAFDSIQTGSLGVLVEPLAMQDLSTSISASGTIESQSKVSVTSDLTYKIAELNVSVGDYVKEGDVLCTFDSTELNAQIQTLEEQLKTSDNITSKQTSINNRTLNEAKEDKKSQLAQASAAVDKANEALQSAKNIKAQLENTNREYQEQIANIKNILSQTSPDDPNYASLSEQLSSLTLASGDIVSKIAEQDSVISSAQAALDEANANYTTVEKTANQQIQAAQDSIDTQETTKNTDSRTELETLKRKFDKIVVKAEHSGIITSINVSTGSIHAGGELMTIQDTNALKLTVSIKENDILKINEGMKAIVTSTANQDIEIEGKVTKVVDFVSQSKTPADGTASESGYSAEITLPDNSGMLLGMTAKAQILTSDENTALAAAYDSIFEEDDKSYVYRAVPSHNNLYKIEKVPVERGVDSDYYTEIISDKLKEGDYIVSFPEEVNEGDEVVVDETYMTGNPDSGEDGE